MARLPSDFTNVFGRLPRTILSRLGKGVSVALGMVRGADTASPHGPVRLQVEVTDKCNFDCIMCNRLTRPNVQFKLNNDIKFATFRRLLDRARPYFVTVNGLGEPVLNKEIDKILAECRRRGIVTQMPSNMSIRKVMVGKVAANPPSVITFSMHGAFKESFEAISVNSEYEDCISLFNDFLARVDRNKVEIRILCAVQAKNLLDYNGFYEHLTRWGLVENFIALPVTDTSADGDGHGGHREDRRYIPTAGEAATALAALERDIAACHEPRKRQFMEYWRNAVQAIKPAEQIVEAGPCLVPWFSTYITAKGKVLPCCYLTDEWHVMGNIYEQDFKDIWNGPRYREFRKQMRENRGQLAGCRHCPRNDTARIKKLNPLSLVPTKWRLNGNHDAPQGEPGREIRIGTGAVVTLTVKGRALAGAASSEV
jgi:radical SAM protein with 4Fe4S-binding SPASM domain